MLTFTEEQLYRWSDFLLRILTSISEYLHTLVSLTWDPFTWITKMANKNAPVIVALLVLWTFIQLKAFVRPPAVKKKRLPQRPALSILFKPDDITSTTFEEENSAPEIPSRLKRRSASNFLRSSFSVISEHLDEIVKEVAFDEHSATSTSPKRPDAEVTSLDGAPELASLEATTGNTTTTPQPKTEKSTKRTFDLPDSFAPLLSSSQTEMLLHHLTADLIHGFHAEAGVKMQPGRHEIPLDMNQSRPQFVLNVPKEGCRLTATASIGSDCFSTAQDLDVTIPTTSRSRPMVKHAGIVFDPALPLANVAPTLIHFPTLFEDNTVIPKLRRIQIFRLFVNSVVAISSFIEKVLWIIEGFLQIHLGKVKITPLYKGKANDDSPEWRLTLAFSGHLLLFGLIPIPFISVILPAFIIPQPHALVEYLLSKQPLASAKIRRERISEQRIAMAVLDTVNEWNSQVQLVATPPAVGIDLTLPGGVSLGIEVMHGRDASAGRSRDDNASFSYMNAEIPYESDPVGTMRPPQSSSGASMSSWTTRSASDIPSYRKAPSASPFDANHLVPWKVEVSAKGSMNKDKMSFHLLNCSLEHEDPSSPLRTKSQFKTRGSFAVWKAMPDLNSDLSSPLALRKVSSFAHRAALAGATDSPTIASILLFPEETEHFHRESRVLQYDYAFDVSEDSKLDSITFSVGANHPMLNGGSMVTTILESIYAFGSVTARDKAILDPLERRRKRNVLRHLPAIDFTFGIQNSYIPPESCSYTNDGQTKTLPGMEGGRIMVRLLGGIEDAEMEGDEDNIGMPLDLMQSPTHNKSVADGIKVVADFGFSSIVLNSETHVNEFPEFDIFEGAKIRALTSGKLGGSIHCHLRPQQSSTSISTTGPNIFNPLEAYEIDCSGTYLLARVKESTTSLGHRRIIIPAATTLKVKVVESIIDMSLEGHSQCELSWDFQGLSPILQVTDIGSSPEQVVHERKEQVSLLIDPLRQGRLNFHVSPVGGVNITKAVTSRENKEGLYDWKFFNALFSVSPDEKSMERLLDVIHDRRSMEKLLQVIKLVNHECYRFCNYGLKQVWRAKEILDQEGISDPKHIIPGHRMARLMSLLLCDDISQADIILPVIRRVVAGDGLDVVTLKDLLREHFEFYDDWAPEIDRGMRWLETVFTPFTVPPNYVENNVTPLAQQFHHFQRFKNLPSAAQLYEQIHDRPDLPLDQRFSNLISRVAPYLSFSQIEYFLKVRSPKDWMPNDLKRLRYVYSVKRKVMDIAESYGGLSFLPQSFLVSVFLGEATRASHRVTEKTSTKNKESQRKSMGINFSNNPSTLLKLRQRRAVLKDPNLTSVPEETMTPAGKVASMSNLRSRTQASNRRLDATLTPKSEDSDEFELGDCLLGPADVAILLQAGLTSVTKGSSVVQLNQRMLLDLIASQPNSFAVAVLAEIGSPGGQGSPRQLASALLALLEFDQNSFRPMHRLDMHALLESWLKLSVPRREDYMAGGRWARQSYYDAIFALAKSILEDAECYMAMKLHLQKVRHQTEAEPIPKPREIQSPSTRLTEAIALAKKKIEIADEKGLAILQPLMKNEKKTKASKAYLNAINAYNEAFEACAFVRDIDKLVFHTEWFSSFYQRNYEALMIKSMFDNVKEDVDSVRYWLHALRRGDNYGSPRQDDNDLLQLQSKSGNFLKNFECIFPNARPDYDGIGGTFVLFRAADENIFLEPEKHTDQQLVNAIIDAIIYDERDRERLSLDPLVRLLIPNPDGFYDFTIVSAMGVITEGKAGTELQSSFERMEKKRGVKTVRSDTATARSFEYNAGKIMEAIETAREYKVPFGLLGYSQGCANALMAESTMLSGTPPQQEEISDPNGLVCRQLLFSAANGSIHGPASDKKVQRLIVMVEEFFKYQQGYFSRALQSAFLETITNALDSSTFHKLMGGAQTFLYDGCRAFWREAQHLSHVPTCTLRGVLEEHTTPEALESISHMLTKQSGSHLHDSQVHASDAVGHPVYYLNRNGKVLEKCDVGEASIQRTHHWSPLNEEVAFIKTQRDDNIASFDCAKDRHIFPWVDVNVRFGFIKYSKRKQSEGQLR